MKINNVRNFLKELDNLYDEERYKFNNEIRLGKCKKIIKILKKEKNMNELKTPINEWTNDRDELQMTYIRMYQNEKLTEEEYEIAKLLFGDSMDSISEKMNTTLNNVEIVNIRVQEEAQRTKESGEEFGYEVE